MASEDNKTTQWKPGQSGNPNGRPAGSRSKVLLALDALGESEANDIVRAMIEKAKEGDTTAAGQILDRVYGQPEKERACGSICSKMRAPKEIRYIQIIEDENDPSSLLSDAEKSKSERGRVDLSSAG